MMPYTQPTDEYLYIRATNLKQAVDDSILYYNAGWEFVSFLQGIVTFKKPKAWASFPFESRGLEVRMFTDRVEVITSDDCKSLIISGKDLRVEDWWGWGD